MHYLQILKLYVNYLPGTNTLDNFAEYSNIKENFRISPRELGDDVA